MFLARLTLSLLLVLPAAVLAHGGRTNAQGCHNDRVNGGYHCHNGGRALPASVADRSRLAPAVTAPAASPSRRVDYSGVGTRPNPYLPAAAGSGLRSRDDPAPRGPTPREASLYFTTCEQAQGAGYAPLHRGQPGYREGLDPDGNGAACEEGFRSGY